MAQEIQVKYKAQLTSEGVNKRLVDIVGENSVIKGFRAVPGGGMNIDLVSDEDDSNVLFIEGARIEETANITGITINGNTSGADRVDVIYAKYDHGQEDAVCEYLVGEGMTTIPSNSCKIAEVVVGDGVTEITENDITKESKILSLKEIEEKLEDYPYVAGETPPEDNNIFWIDTSE